jgi:hypothetical protein
MKGSIERELEYLLFFGKSSTCSITPEKEKMFKFIIEDWLL